VVGKDLLAPVPAGPGQAVRLYTPVAGCASRWSIFNAAAQPVASLSFGASETAQWLHLGVSPGVYFARVEITPQGGSTRVLWQQLVLVP
jgi:hypothetical protein